ncbi:MAG: 2-phospho-L-lactate guanylyltransferase [Candidatus Caldarchaeum sp.]
MRALAILPVKNLQRAKTRLSTVLSKSERKMLVLNLFLRTGRLCQRAGFKVLSLTPDDTVAEISLRMGWLVFREDFNNLNKALANVFKSFSNVPLLIVLPDLPLLSLDALETVHMLGRRYGCVICPDLRLKGTNMLYLDGAGFFKPMFGSGSFQRHLNQLRKRSAVKVFVKLETALDLDSPEDLLLLSRLSFSLPVYGKKGRYQD